MKTLKKIGAVLLKVIIGFLAIVVLYLVIAIIAALIPVNSGFKNLKKGNEIWISSNGVHTNIIVPVNNTVINWKNFLKLENDYTYLAFGWGDEEFYMNTPTWADLKFGTAIKAVFWPTKSVIQVYGISSKPSLSKLTKKLVLTDKQAAELNNYLHRSFNLNDDGSPVELIPEKGPGALYHYYRAKGKYTMFYTCNNWTSRGLKHIGVKNSLWAPFDKSVLFYLK